MKFTFPPESKPLEGYTIKRAIHRGGFGEVYYALSEAGKEVALKLLQQNLEIELRGVRQCLNLKHPNLVTIFDIRTDRDGDHWIVMEYVHGKSLDRIIDQYNGPMPIEAVESWLAGMVAGLSFLHDRGIVHRDLKPANVFQENGVVKIGDVGLAKFITQSKRSAQTESVGTVYYMAPEVARGRYGHEVDVYSLGVVLYEMLTGRVPFDGESTAEILMKHLSDRPDLSPVPKRLRPVLAEALEKDPLKRTPRIEGVLSNFRKAVAGVEIPTTIPEESFRAARPQAAVPVSGDSAGKPDRHAGFFEWPDVNDKKWNKELEKLDRKTARHERIEARKQARHARRMERRAARHQQKMERKAARNGDVAVEVVHFEPTEPQPRRNDTSSKRQSRSRAWVGWAKVAAIVLIAMAVVMPRGFVAVVQTLFRGALLGGIAYGAYRLVSYLVNSSSQKMATATHGPARRIPVDDLERKPAGRSQPPRAVPTNAGRPPAPSRFHPFALTPDTPRQVSLRARVTELSGSLSFAVLCTGIITAAVAFLSPTVQTPARIVLFSTVSLLAAWGVLVVSKWHEGTRIGSGHRRLATMLVGGLVGAAAFTLHSFLLVRFNRADYNLHPGGLVHTIGTVNLTDALQPTLAGYVVFFAGLFVLRHWWRNADSLRRSRVSVGSVLLTTAVGLVWSVVMTFPMLWGVTWAAAVACIVQLSAVWMAPGERRELQEAGHA